MLPHIEKTIRFLSKSSNPSSIDLLRFLLDDIDREVREKALEGLYMKKDPAIMLELFHLISQNEQQWQACAFLTPERLSRLAEQAIRSGDFELAKQGCDIAHRNKLYETLPAVISLLEVPRPEWVDLSAEIILKLAVCFYDDLADAANGVERRNMDRRRGWFASQLEDPVKRFGIHRRIEPVKAFLLVAKKNHPFLISILGDVHSQVCKAIVELLQNNEEGRYYRLLLGFIDDANAPPVIDLILTSKSDKKFVGNLLKMVGNTPSQITKDALKRFKEFSWIYPGNETIPELIEGNEGSFVQLVACATLSRQTTLEMLRLVFSLPSESEAGRRAAVKAIRAFSGDDVNNILIAAWNDSDPFVCSEVLRILKTRRVKEVDQLIMQNCEHPSELVRKTIYELMPEFRIESFFQKIGQLTDNMAQTLGHIILNIDPNTRKRISQEISSAIPIRRKIAVDTMRYMNLAAEYKDTLIDLFENDDEMEIRIVACLALSQVLTVESFHVLQQAAESRNLGLQRAGIEATEIWQENLERLQRQQATADSAT